MRNLKVDATYDFNNQNQDSVIAPKTHSYCQEFAFGGRVLKPAVDRSGEGGWGVILVSQSEGETSLKSPPSRWVIESASAVEHDGYLLAIRDQLSVPKKQWKVA